MTGEIYHVFNRGVNKSNIFFKRADYSYFLEAARHYRTETIKFSRSVFGADPVSAKEKSGPFVEIYAYCLMPNHFHFLVKQLVDDGITSYFRRVSNSYSHHLNLKYKRVGTLFESRFKNVLVESEDQLVHLSRYIHLNPAASNLIGNAKRYEWSSYKDYFEEGDEFVSTDLVMGLFKSGKNYEEFVADQVDYARQLHKLKHSGIEYDYAETGSAELY